MVATGIGAAPGAVVVTAGGATAAVGGGVSAVGAIVEGVATGLDALATLVSGGQLNVLALATASAQRVVMSKIDKLTKIIPGKKKPAAAKNDAAPPPKPGAAGDGVRIAGSGVTGPCIVGSYKELKGPPKKCPTGQQAHHIVPDKYNRTGNRAQSKKGKNRVPGMPTLDNGPSICLQGQASTEGTEHNTAHQGDRDVKELGLRTDNGPPNTAPVAQVVPKVMSAAIAARPECKAQIEAAVRKAYPNYESDNRSMRTTDSTSKGEAKGHLDAGGQATGNQGGKTKTRKRK